jgi:hypothetical protein
VWYFNDVRMGVKKKNICWTSRMGLNENEQGLQDKSGHILLSQEWVYHGWPQPYLSKSKLRPFSLFLPSKQDLTGAKHYRYGVSLPTFIL